MLTSSYDKVKRNNYKKYLTATPLLLLFSCFSAIEKAYTITLRDGRTAQNQIQQHSTEIEGSSSVGLSDSQIRELGFSIVSEFHLTASGPSPENTKSVLTSLPAGIICLPGRHYR